MPYKKYRTFLVIFLLFFIANAFAYPNAIVNVPVANMYKQPNIDAPVVSQTMYGVNVDVVQKNNRWSLIGTHDLYQGWVQNAQLVFKPKVTPKHFIKVNILFAAIYRELDMNKHSPIMIGYSTTLTLKRVVDEKWVEVELPTGKSGFMRRGDVVVDAKPLTMAQMLKVSRKFVGLPYVWAQVSPFGFDCSGFIQFLYKQIGIDLPRDAGLMAKWPGFITVARKNLQPGDVLLMGYDGEISHASMYLGNGYIIHSTSFRDSTVKVSKLNDEHWDNVYITARRLKQIKKNSFNGSITIIPKTVEQQMRQYTWHKDCPVPIRDLRYLTLTYWGFDNKSHQGVLIVHKNLAPEVIKIFENLYVKHFPINQMRPMYLYKGSDDNAMLANNTAAFNCRRQTDFPKLFSAHSYGAAIDINPLINPYINKGKVEPSVSKKYLSRTTPRKGKIIPNGIVVQEFYKYGWTWGGHWKSKVTDYMHFQKHL